MPERQPEQYESLPHTQKGGVINLLGGKALKLRDGEVFERINTGQQDTLGTTPPDLAKELTEQGD